MHERSLDSEQRGTHLELFVDLVYVVAFHQVPHFLARLAPTRGRGPAARDADPGAPSA